MDELRIVGVLLTGSLSVASYAAGAIEVLGLLQVYLESVLFVVVGVLLVCVEDFPELLDRQGLTDRSSLVDGKNAEE